MKQEIKPATGRLGVLVVGVGGAVATTMIVGTLASRKGLAKPIGSITQLATMRMENNEEKLIKDVVPLTNLEDIVFGGWDIFPDNAYEAAMYAEVLKEKDLNGVKEELEAIKPMPAAFDHNWAKRLNGTHVKKAATRWEMVEQLRQDIRDFKAANNCERVVVLWAASTEIYIPLSDHCCCCLPRLLLPLSAHLHILSKNLLYSLPLSDLYTLRSKLSMHLCFHAVQAL